LGGLWTTSFRWQSEAAHRIYVIRAYVTVGDATRTLSYVVRIGPLVKAVLVARAAGIGEVTAHGRIERPVSLVLAADSKNPRSVSARWTVTCHRGRLTASRTGGRTETEFSSADAAPRLPLLNADYCEVTVTGTVRPRQRLLVEVLGQSRIR